MHSIRMPRGDTPTFLTHLFGGGLDDDKYPRRTVRPRTPTATFGPGVAGSGRLPIRECGALDSGALEHETPRCQSRSTDYTTHGLSECQSNDGSRVGRYAKRLRDRHDLRGVGRRSGGDIANAVPGQVSLPDVRERSPGPDDRPCFESASPGRAEPAAVLVPAGFGLRGCGILHCRFADRRPRRVTGRRTRRVVSLRLHLQLRGHAR